MSKSLALSFAAILFTFAAYAAPAINPREEKLTQEHFDQINNGMTKAEVIEIMGQNRSGASQGKDSSLAWYFSGDSSHKAEVHFKDGIVVSKRNTIDWKKHGVAAAPSTKPAAVAGTAPAEPEDKLAATVAALRSNDRNRVRHALETLSKTPRDDDHAAEISLLLEKHFAGKDEFVKMDARIAISEWCTIENGPFFIKIIEHHSRGDARRATNDDQDFAMKILTRIKDPNAVAPIAKLLTHFFDRDEASKALIAFGPELAQAEVLKFANHKDPSVALAARKILDEFKSPPAVLLERNLTDLKSTVADKRLWAVQAIEKMEVIPARRKEVAIALEPLLADKYAWPAHAAAAALVKWGVPENEGALIKALSHASPDMRRLAANALKNVGTKQSLPALQALITKADPLHHEAAEAAQEAIKAINARLH